MGMKNFLIIVIVLFTAIFSVQSQSSKIEFDSLINYEVKKKETLFSISKKFKIEINDLLSFNTELKNNKLKKNSIIIIPKKRL